MTQYLIGAGAAKCGTTLLYDLLQPHPMLSKSNVKELHYFDHTDTPDKAQYDALFDDSDDIKLDVTPIYMFYQECMEKIAHTLGPENVHIVVLLRDPIERARSHYYMLRAQGQEKRSFRESFEQEAERMAQNERGRRLGSYFSRGRYSEQLANIYRYVPAENVRVYIFEEFVKNQQRVIDQICDFVGIEHIVVRDKHSNRGVVNVRVKWLANFVCKLSRNTPRLLKFRPLRTIKHMITGINEKPSAREPLDPQFHAKLVCYYQADVNRLREQFGLDISAWPNFGDGASPTKN